MDTWPLPAESIISSTTPAVADQYPPPGCTCISTAAATGSICEAYTCGCACDLTAGACDANCCCDTECPAAQISTWQNAGLCLPEGQVHTGIQLCTDLDNDPDLVAVNAKYGMSVSQVGATERVLCVEVDNNPTAGEFFNDPVAAESKGIGSLLGASVFDRADLVAMAKDTTFPDALAASTATLGTTYSAGDMVQGAVSVSGTLYATAAGLRMPSSTSGGTCAVQGTHVRYQTAGTWSSAASGPAVLQQLPMTGLGAAQVTALLGAAAALGNVGSDANQIVGSLAGTSDALGAAWADWSAAFADSNVISSCSYALPLSATTCGAASATAWLAQLRIGVRPTASVADSTTFLTPAIVNVTTVTAAGVSNTAAATSAPATTFNATACACNNTLTSAHFQFITDGAGSITDVQVQLVLAEIAPTASCTATGVVPFTITASWTSSSTTTGSVSANNATPRQRSGSPGYLIGAPVLAGSATTVGAKSAVAAVQRGLTVLGPAADGSCAASASAASQAAVLFGQDLRISCIEQLSDAQLQAQCASAALPTSSLGVPSSLVGTLGSAEPAAAWQWGSISADPSTVAAGTWDATTRTCTGGIVGLHLQLAAARIGKGSDGQWRLVGARWRWITGNRQARASPGAAQAYELATVVSWTMLPDSSLTPFVPPAPQAFPKLPSDLFYPFEVGSSLAAATEPAARLSTWASSVLVALCAVLLAQA